MTALTRHHAKGTAPERRRAGGAHRPMPAQVPFETTRDRDHDQRQVRERFDDPRDDDRLRRAGTVLQRQLRLGQVEADIPVAQPFDGAPAVGIDNGCDGGLDGVGVRRDDPLLTHDNYPLIQSQGEHLALFLPAKKHKSFVHVLLNTPAVHSGESSTNAVQWCVPGTFSPCKMEFLCGPAAGYANAVAAAAGPRVASTTRGKGERGEAPVLCCAYGDQSCCANQSRRRLRPQAFNLNSRANSEQLFRRYGRSNRHSIFRSASAAPSAPRGSTSTASASLRRDALPPSSTRPSNSTWFTQSLFIGIRHWSNKASNVPTATLRSLIERQQPIIVGRSRVAAHATDITSGPHVDAATASKAKCPTSNFTGLSAEANRSLFPSTFSSSGWNGVSGNGHTAHANGCSRALDNSPTLCTHPDYCFHYGCPWGCEHSSRGDVEGNALQPHGGGTCLSGAASDPKRRCARGAGFEPGPRETIQSSARRLHAPFRSGGGEPARASSRAGAFTSNVNASPSHDLEAAYGVAGEKPRHVCIEQTLIARRAGKPMRATPHGSFGLSIRRRADAQEGRVG